MFFFLRNYIDALSTIKVGLNKLRKSQKSGAIESKVITVVKEMKKIYVGKEMEREIKNSRESESGKVTEI